MQRGASQRLSRAAGKAWERGIEASLEMARRSGALAHWAHNEPHFRNIGGKFIPVATGVADYTGVLRGGLALAIECKATADERYYRRSLPEQQVEHLDAVARAGGLALLALEFRGAIGPARLDRARALWKMQQFVVPWTCVPWHRVRSAESVGPADILPRYQLARPLFLAPFVHDCLRCTKVWPRSQATCTCGTLLSE